MARRRGHFADLRYPATPTLAHTLMRADDGTDFGPLRNGEGAAPAGAHSLRECGRAMARRREQFADLRYPVTHRCFASTFSWADDGTDFGPFRNGEGAAPAGALSLRECGRAMARRRGHFADLRYPATPTLAHTLMRADDGTDFGPLRNGEGAAPAGAHSLRECGRAMARRREQFGDLRYPVTHRCLHPC